MQSSSYGQSVSKIGKHTMSFKHLWILLLVGVEVYAALNLVPNPTFQPDGKGGIAEWESTPLVQEQNVKDGALHIELPAFKHFKFDSRMVELNQEKPVTLRYSLDFKGETIPVPPWRHGILLDKLEYMDGTTEGWSDTQFIFRSRSRSWATESFTWLPPKPIKRFRVSLLFTSSKPADFWLRNISITEDPNAFNTPDWEENFGTHPTNLVPNPGFETVKGGDVKNWVKFTEIHPLNAGLKENLEMSFDSSCPHSGNYALKLSNSKDSLSGRSRSIWAAGMAPGRSAGGIRPANGPGCRTAVSAVSPWISGYW